MPTYEYLYLVFLDTCCPPGSLGSGGVFTLCVCFGFLPRFGFRPPRRRFSGSHVAVLLLSDWISSLASVIDDDELPAAVSLLLPTFEDIVDVTTVASVLIEESQSSSSELSRARLAPKPEIPTTGEGDTDNDGDS